MSYKVDYMPEEMLDSIAEQCKTAIALLPVLASFVKSVAADKNATPSELEAMAEVAKAILDYK